MNYRSSTFTETCQQEVLILTDGAAKRKDPYLSQRYQIYTSFRHLNFYDRRTVSDYYKVNSLIYFIALLLI